MKRLDRIVKGVVIIATFSALTAVNAQRIPVNLWRGDETGADWTDDYKWKLMHAPTTDESVHFRNPNDVITVSSTVYLNNGMHLYGQELSLRGNGNINLRNPVPHQQTINVPASATGYATLTLNDNLSINGRMALSAKGFGTSACKGAITLKDRSMVKGVLAIGNDGVGTGQVYVKGNSTYHITGLELETKAASGGAAEIHVLGGAVRIETDDNPFTAFLRDPSRKLILGDAGTIRIEHNLPPEEKKKAIKKMITRRNLVAAPGCRLLPPVIHDNMMIIRAEDERNENSIATQEALLAAIDKVPVKAAIPVSESDAKPELESLLKNMTQTPALAEADTPEIKETPEAGTPQGGTKMAGYIVFFGTVLLTLRRSKDREEEKGS